MPRLLLALFLFFTVTSHAFQKGDAVYAKIELDDSWLPAKYDTLQGNCFVTEHPKSKELQVRIPSKLVEGEIKSGSEVRIRVTPTSNPAFPFRVVSAGIKCHAVERGTLRYAKLRDVLLASHFKKLVGSKQNFAIGNQVYTNKSAIDERWVPAEISGKRDDCFQTDTDTVLKGDEFGTVFKEPSAASNIKVGDSVLVSPADATISGKGWVEMKVKAVKGNQLTVATPLPEDPGDQEETVKAEEVKRVPTALNEKEFAALKPGSKVLHFGQPASFDSPFYQPLRIVSSIRSCYTVQINGEPFARLEAQLISKEDLPK